jgi:hypothetical protein
MSAFLYKYHQSEGEPPPFQDSADFMNPFKSRHGFTSRRINCKRRPVVTEEQRQNWIQEIQKVFQTVPLSRIVKCDETAWFLDPNSVLTWAERRSKSIQTKINGSEKNCVIILASVTAVGAKIPLALIAVGKTGRIEQS